MPMIKIFYASILAIFIFANASYAASVKVTVNNFEITDTQISARAKLLAAERRGNSNRSRNKLATEELVDEQLKLQEAARIGAQISDAQVEAAYLNVARNIKVSKSKLTSILQSAGVNPSTLRDRLRANAAWQAVTQTVVASRVNLSDLDLEQKALEKVSAATSFDYILKEVRFIIPQGSKTSTSRRTAQANQYRKNFKGCDTAIELSLSYTDAAVLDMGRRHATQLPEAIAKELGALEVGGMTKPRVGNGGVSMLAVCSKTAAQDTAYIKGKIRREEGTEKFSAETDKHLETLRSRAAIFYK